MICLGLRVPQHGKEPVRMGKSKQLKFLLDHVEPRAHAELVVVGPREAM